MSSKAPFVSAQEFFCNPTRNLDQGKKQATKPSSNFFLTMGDIFTCEPPCNNPTSSYKPLQAGAKTLLVNISRPACKSCHHALTPFEHPERKVSHTSHKCNQPCEANINRTPTNDRCRLHYHQPTTSPPGPQSPSPRWRARPSW